MIEVMSFQKSFNRILELRFLTLSTWPNTKIPENQDSGRAFQQ